MQKQFEDGTKNTAVGKMSGIVDSDSGKSSPPPRAPRCMPPAFGVLELLSAFVLAHAVMIVAVTVMLLP